MPSWNFGDIVFLVSYLKNTRRAILYPIYYVLSFVWLLSHHFRIILGRYERMPIPVVCVGNVTLGGAGKTPTVIYLANYFKKNSIKAHVVSRGYGGKFKDVVSVDPRSHNAYEVGDEPLLISQHTKVWVSKKKKEGILKAYKEGAELVILDDGHQNFSIAKDINILVFDAEVNLENEKIFPVGNLRESPRNAIDRADFLIFIGSSELSKKLTENFFKKNNQNIIDGKFKPNIIPKLKKRNLVAFCGIGRPEKFFSMLRKLNLNVIREYSFPDHHLYSREQLTKISDVAAKNNALVVTTEKDFVRIPLASQKKIYAINIELYLSKNKKLLLELKKLVS